MNPFLEILKDSDVRGLMVKPSMQIGYGNLAKSALRASKAKKAQGKSGDSIGRYLLPELWKGLGSKKAVVTDTTTVTFEELADRALRLSNQFYNMGLRQGDRVATFVMNEQAWFDVMTASMITGLRMPMLNIHLKPEELLKCINNCEPKILVFSHAFLDKIKTIEADIVGVQQLVCACTEEEAKDLPESMCTLESLVKKGEPVLEGSGIGLAQMAFSGGSTGVPKFIVEKKTKDSQNPRMEGLTPEEHKIIKSKFVHGLCGFGLGRIKGDIVSLIPGPLYHAGVQTAVLPIYFGSTIVPMQKYSAENYLRLIEQEKVNYSFVAPTMLERILKLPEEIKSKYDLSSMQIVLCAAAPCADYVKIGINELFKKQGAKHNVFNEYYGSSECAVISVLRPKDYEEKPERYKSVGKAIGSDCMVYDVENGRQCKPGEDGHVIARNSRMYEVHYGNSDEMDNAFVKVDGAYWFDDGCIGHMDEDGFLYLTSRSKDMLISGGVNVFPVEIEEVIRSHGNVLDVAVVKVADKDLGEVPGAIIQTVDGNEIPFEEVINYCKEKGLYGFKIPKQVKFIDELPKNTAGKIRKKDLEGIF